MSSDDLHRKLIQLGKRPFRRIRKHQGETWQPERSKDVNTAIGPWCASCRTRHGWRSPTLYCFFEKRKGTWYILWTCVRTGDVIKEQALPNGTGVGI